MGERLLIVAAVIGVLVAVWLVVRLYTVLVRSRLNAQARQRARGIPQLFFFTAERCAQCHSQKRVVEALAARFGEHLHVERIDAGASPEVARQYGILTVPSTVVVDADGTIRAINYGLTSAHQLEQQLGLGVPDLVKATTAQDLR